MNEKLVDTTTDDVRFDDVFKLDVDRVRFDTHRPDPDPPSPEGNPALQLGPFDIFSSTGIFLCGVIASVV